MRELTAFQMRNWLALCEVIQMSCQPRPPRISGFISDAVDPNATFKMPPMKVPKNIYLSRRGVAELFRHSGHWLVGLPETKNGEFTGEVYGKEVTIFIVENVSDGYFDLTFQ
jgi:hypothetical protein